MLFRSLKVARPRPTPKTTPTPMQKTTKTKSPNAFFRRALPCTRDFFVKKSSKNFISAAAGNGYGYDCFCSLPRPPQGRRAGCFYAFIIWGYFYMDRKKRPGRPLFLWKLQADFFVIYAFSLASISSSLYRNTRTSATAPYSSGGISKPISACA